MIAAMLNTTKSSYRPTLANVPVMVSQRVEFTVNGNISGHRGNSQHGLGRLPSTYWDELNVASQDMWYTITSYGTPIAWLANGVWYVPDVKYSVTTSRHQRLVLQGIARTSFPCAVGPGLNDEMYRTVAE